MPVGVMAVPASVSVTVPVQAVAELTATVDGTHVTAIEEARTVAVREYGVAALDPWSVSPP